MLPALSSGAESSGPLPGGIRSLAWNLSVGLTGGVLAAVLGSKSSSATIAAGVLCAGILFLSPAFSIRNAVQRSRGQPIPRFPFVAGRVLCLVVAYVPTHVVVQLLAEAAFSDVMQAVIGGALFGFHESLAMSVAYRVCFRREPSKPIYLLPPPILVPVYALAVPAIILFEDLDWPRSLVDRLLPPVALCVLAVAQTAPAVAFARVTSKTSDRETT